MLRTSTLAALLALPTTLTAQVPVPRQEASTRNKHLAALGLVASPSVSETSLASPTVELTAASGDKQAVARIGVTADDENFALTLTTPLQDLPKQSVPLSLEGLTSGSSAAFSYNRILWRYQADHQSTQAVCRKYSVTHSENCTASVDVPSDKQDAFMMEVGYTRPWVFGLSGRIGRQTFDWVDPNSLESGSVEHNSTGGGAWLGTFLPQGFLVVKYSYQSGYRGAQRTTFCRPIGTAGATSCEDTALAGPTKVQESIVSAELRRHITDNLAMTAIVRKNLDTHVWSWEVPFYFLKDKSSGLSGGASIGKRSDEKTVSIRVFVGAAFELFYVGK